MLPPAILERPVIERPAPTLDHATPLEAAVHRSVDAFLAGDRTASTIPIVVASADVPEARPAVGRAAFTPTAEYQREKAWAEAHGVRIPAGKVTVVAKRRGADARTTQYQDEIVVFQKNGAVARFAATTKPAQEPRAGSALVPDVNGDGQKDLGMVRPGVYSAVGPWSFGLPGDKRASFKVVQGGRDSLPAWRDLDGDGRFSDAEKRTSEARGYRIGAVRIHYGFDPQGTTIGGDRYSGAWSVGCQNIAYGDLDRFVAAVGGRSASFTYAIVDD